MSHRGSKAAKESAWQREQYVLGRKHGLTDHQGGYSDRFYQRGWRSGVDDRDRLIVVKQTEWRGIIPHSVTVHRAVLAGEILGEWSREMAAPWLDSVSGAPVMAYKDWLAEVRRLAPIVEAAQR